MRFSSLSLCVVLGVLPFAAGCRGTKASLDTEYLVENEVYRSRTFVREPYLFEVRDHDLEIICRTFDRSPPRVEVSPFADTLVQAWTKRLVTPSEEESRRLRTAGLPARLPLWQHHLVLSGLQPRAEYSVRLQVGEERVEVTARTLPPLAAPQKRDTVSFLVLGGTGTGSDDALGVARAIERGLDKEGAPSKGIDFIVHTGDLAYDEGAAEDYEATFFSPYRKILQRVPVYGVLGERDAKTSAGAAFFEAFPRATVRQPFTRVSLGLVELILADSTPLEMYGEEGKPSDDDLREPGRQQLWLERQLARPTESWRFLVTHHPMLSAGNGAGSSSYCGDAASAEMRRAMAASLGKVPFVLQGKDPHYERSVPLMASWVDANGCLKVPAHARGMSRTLALPPMPRRVQIAGKTVAIVQAAGGGEVGDTVAARTGWAALWVVGLPFLSPLWLSYLPVGPDWVDTQEAWVDRADAACSVTRFDVTSKTVRLRTWKIDPETGKHHLGDDILYFKDRKDLQQGSGKKGEFSHEVKAVTDRDFEIKATTDRDFEVK